MIQPLLQLAALLFTLGFAGPGFANDVLGVVASVIDGDTLLLHSSSGSYERIRLADIDSPELDQPWGAESKAALEEWALGKSSRIEVLDSDRYGRLVATVFVAGKNLNRALVEKGHAWVYRSYLRDKSLIGIESQARRSRIGLWSAETPIQPSDWRARSRKTLLPPAAEILRPVKKSRSGICHAPGTTYYSRTLHFHAFESLGACLNSGGRLPKR